MAHVYLTKIARFNGGQQRWWSGNLLVANCDRTTL